MDNAMAVSVQRKPRTWLRFTLMFLFVGMMAGGLIGFHRFKANILKQVTAGIQSQVPTVATATATLQEWQPKLTAVGTTRAARGADLAAEVSGIVDDIHFDSGQTIAAGTALLRLRSNDDDAKLAQLQATADVDEVTYQRDLRQLQVKGVAQATVDVDAANLRVARAQVAAQQALMAEKVVKAPFAGRLGVRQVDVGQYLAVGTAIVSLQSLDTMYVDFHLPQQDLGKLAVGQTVDVTTDAYPDTVFKGQLSAIDSKVDAGSRMVAVRATVPNPKDLLLPGMFVDVGDSAGAPQKRVTVPQTAIAVNPYGSLVYVVNDAPDGRKMVRQVFVTTGEQRGDQISVVKGLAAGDVVVTAGQIKLHNDMAVNINNQVQPSDDPAPLPVDR